MHSLKALFKSAIREPLFHFIIAGFFVFMLMSLTDNVVDPSSRRINITAKKIEQLSQNWRQSWSRLPTAHELDGLIRDDIKDEIYYREAIRLGLDKEDQVIRRRLRSKMEYLAITAAESERPSNAVLEAWIRSHAEKYTVGSKYSFDQIYFGDDEEAPAQARAMSALIRLRAGENWQNLGDEISLPKSLTDAVDSEIDRSFGANFAQNMREMKIGEWSGPIQSGFGLHLLRVNATKTGSLPPLSEIKTRVENDWRTQTTAIRENEAYQKLLDGYTINIERPE